MFYLLVFCGGYCVGVVAVIATIILQPQSATHCSAAPAVPTFEAAPAVSEREREGIMNEDDYARFQQQLECRVGVFTAHDQERLYKAWKTNRQDLTRLERRYGK